MADTSVLPSSDASPGHGLDPIPKEVAIAGALIPWPRDDEKARYLGYLACGFSVREALHMVKRAKSSLSAWRHDPTFESLENRIPDIRKELAKEYIELEFFRNFRLALEKDYRVLKKSLEPAQQAVYDEAGNITAVEDLPMSRQDHEYLIKLRSQYSPQQLQILEAIVSGTDSGFNFARWVAENQEIVQMSRTDTVTVQRSGKGDDS